MNRVALDLEMWADRGTNADGSTWSKVEDIIQIGVTAFNPVTGDILEVKGWYVKCPKPLTPYITNLTNITQETLDKEGISFREAYIELVEFCNKHNVWKQLVCWGLDQEELRDGFDMCESDFVEYEGQDYNKETHHLEISRSLSDGSISRTWLAPNSLKWEFGKSGFNIKHMYQALRIAENKNKSGGLGESLKNLGLTFQPYDVMIDGKKKQIGAHDARTDSLNTVFMYMKLMEKVKGVSIE